VYTSSIHICDMLTGEIYQWYFLILKNFFFSTFLVVPFLLFLRCLSFCLFVFFVLCQLIYVFFFLSDSNKPEDVPKFPAEPEIEFVSESDGYLATLTLGIVRIYDTRTRILHSTFPLSILEPIFLQHNNRSGYKRKLCTGHKISYRPAVAQSPTIYKYF
jgi:hypothetical protein